jgi:hypothetical protein
MRTRYRKILVAAGTTLASLAILAPAADAATPAAPYEDFAGCPSPAESEAVAQCFKYTFDGGSLKLGGVEIPVTNPIVLRGGAESITGNFIGNSEAGIVPVQQKVAGGLGGLIGTSALKESYAPSLLKVAATVELAGTPSSLSVLPIALPIKVHLENPLLGNKCYIGSNSNPIVLNLTTGTTSPPAPNGPITGQPAGELEPDPSREGVKVAEGGVFVDNAFAVPTSSCFPLSILINPANHLPSAAGKNSAVLDYDFARAFPETVYP